MMVVDVKYVPTVGSLINTEFNTVNSMCGEFLGPCLKAHEPSLNVEA